MTLIETLEREFPPMAIALADVAPEKRREMLHRSFMRYCGQGRDAEALMTFGWYLLSARESPKPYESAPMPDFEAQIAVRLLDIVTTEIMDPGFERVPETRKLLFSTIAAGIRATPGHERAEDYLRLLCRASAGSDSNLKAAVAAVRAAIENGKQPLRISQLLACDGWPAEIRNTLMIALIRNSEDDMLGRAIEITTMLEGCTPHAIVQARAAVKRIAEFDAEARAILDIVREYTRWFVQASYDMPERTVTIAVSHTNADREDVAACDQLVEDLCIRMAEDRYEGWTIWMEFTGFSGQARVRLVRGRYEDFNNRDR